MSSCARKVTKKLGEDEMRRSTKMFPNVWLRDMVKKKKVTNLKQQKSSQETIWDNYF